MNINLCKIFGVDPDQEFYTKVELYAHDTKCRVHNNELQREYKGNWIKSATSLNDITHMKIINYSATEDEKIILKNLDDEYKNSLIGRDIGNQIYICISFGGTCRIYYIPYSHLFQFIQCGNKIPIKDIIGEEE